MNIEELRSTVARLSKAGVACPQSEQGGWKLYENEAALYELQQLAPTLASTVLEQADTIERLLKALEANEKALSNAVEVIEKHVPTDALGSNWEGNDEVTGGVRSWPIKEEYLHYMHEALTTARAALSPPEARAISEDRA